MDRRTIDIAEVLQALHDSEISGKIEWLFDKSWHAEVGCPPHAEAIVDTAAEAIEWLRATAIQIYPNSPFAEKYRRGFE